MGIRPAFWSADAALYEAKQAGRSRVCGVHQPRLDLYYWLIKSRAAAPPKSSGCKVGGTKEQ